MNRNEVLLSDYREKMFIFKEKGHTVIKVCEVFNISRTTYYRWKERKDNGEPLIDRSSKPKSSPKMFDKEIEELIIDERITTWYCPLKIAMVLKRKGINVSASGVYSVLKRHGLNRKPRIKKEEVKRYEKDKPFEMLHVDIKYMGRLNNSKKRAYQFSAVDDCTRLAFAKVYDRKTSKNAVDFLEELIKYFGVIPYSIMTDNGIEFTKSKGQSGKRENHKFEKALSKLGIKHIYTKIRRPQTNGKVERFHRIVDEELYQIVYLKDENHREQSLRRYLIEYNFKRPHMGIKGMTPIEKLEKITGRKVMLQVA